MKTTMTSQQTLNAMLEAGWMTRLTKIQFYTFMAYYKFADNKTRESWPGASTIGRMIGCSQSLSHVWRARADLVRFGLLKRKRPGGGSTSAVFELNFPGPPPPLPESGSGKKRSPLPESGARPLPESGLQPLPDSGLITTHRTSQGTTYARAHPHRDTPVNKKLPPVEASEGVKGARSEFRKLENIALLESDLDELVTALAGGMLPIDQVHELVRRINADARIRDPLALAIKCITTGKLPRPTRAKEKSLAERVQELRRIRQGFTTDQQPASRTAIDSK